MMDWVDKIRENLDMKTASLLKIQVCFLVTLNIAVYLFLYANCGVKC